MQVFSILRPILQSMHAPLLQHKDTLAFIDTCILYCMKVLQQAEYMYTVKDCNKLLLPYTFVESVIIECLQILNSIAKLYPTMVSKIYQGLKKFFTLFCDWNRAQQQQSNMPTTSSNSKFSPYSKQRHALSPAFAHSPHVNLSSPLSAAKHQSPSMKKQSTATTAMYQDVAHTRSHASCLWIHFFTFFLQNSGTLAFDSQSIFQTLFTEQFAYCCTCCIFNNYFLQIKMPFSQ